eukprot:TRINITY_DN15510_c0_g1_i1.p1 TRINITY_DN15510_c0_g1~~TRINITY_DN15510_c0_g1_i1.p1  ORF type:complete len:480 (-),score=122.12 TRINITY_DN15510_c0_g1_i1:285-1508(-)
MASALQKQADLQVVQLRAAQEEIQRREEDLRNYPLPAYLVQGEGHINVAITGNSGVGKSSFSNRVRRLKKGQPGYAPTGVIETTRVPQLYKFPTKTGLVQRFKQSLASWLSGSSDAGSESTLTVGERVVLSDGHTDVEVLEVHNDTIVVKRDDGVTLRVSPGELQGKLAQCNLWDLPGAGTPSFPAETYLQVMGIRHFDLVVLMTADRFTEAENKLVKELNHFKVPYFLVRNKVDQAIASAQAEAAEEEEEISEDDIITTIKESFADMGKIFTYVISTMPNCHTKYDFPRLEEDMRAAVMRQRCNLPVPEPDREPDREAAVADVESDLPPDVASVAAAAAAAAEGSTEAGISGEDDDMSEDGQATWQVVERAGTVAAAAEQDRDEPMAEQPPGNADTEMAAPPGLDN